MVLENSYYWRRPPAFIRLRSRTGLGVAPLGSGAAPLVCRSNPVCPDNLTPRLRWIFVQLKRSESEQVFKRAPTWSGLQRLTRHPYPESTVIPNAGVQSCMPTHAVVVRIAPLRLYWKSRAGRTFYFVDLQGHAPGVRLVRTVGWCSCPKRITSQKAKRLFCSKHSLLW